MFRKIAITTFISGILATTAGAQEIPQPPPIPQNGESQNSNNNIWVSSINRGSNTIKGTTTVQTGPLPSLPKWNQNIIRVSISAMLNKYSSTGKTAVAKGTNGKVQPQNFAGQGQNLNGIQYIPAGTQTTGQSNGKPNGQIGQQTVSSKQNQPITTYGYCTFEREIDVYGTAPVFASVNCILKDFPYPVQVYGELKPNLQSYSLNFVPREVWINGVMYPATGYSLSADRTTANVASDVNLRLIQKELASAVGKTAEDTSKMIQEQIKGLYENPTTPSISATDNASVTVEQRKFDMNVILSASLWDLVANTVGGLANVVKTITENVPAIFKIQPGTTIWIYLKIYPPNSQNVNF